MAENEKASCGNRCSDHSGVVASITETRRRLDRFEVKLDKALSRLPMSATILISVLTAFCGALVRGAF